MLINPNHLVRELQAWLNLSLNTYENYKCKKYKLLIWRTNKLIMKIFINSNTSLGCLHSKDMVLHACSNLLENMLQCQLPRWYGRVLSNLILTFPKLDSLQCPQIYVTPDHQKLKVLILYWHRNLTLVFAGSRPIGPLHLNSFLDAHRCHLDWINWFLAWGNQSPKG